MYEARSYEEILREMQEKWGSPAAKVEGTFEWDALSASAFEFAKVEVELEEAYNAAFADTSWGEYLTMRAKEYGVIRKNATYAKATLTVTGTGTIAAGSIFATVAGLRFAADEEVVIEDTGTIEVTAVNAGSDYNVAANAITEIPMSIPGITAVTNEDAAHDGYNEESDEELLTRYLLKVRMPATSGNRLHYIEWALSVEGVGSVKVIPLWAGNGTVKVVIVDSNLHAASDELVQNVTDYLLEVQPIGADVTVVSAVETPINIHAKIYGAIDETAFANAANIYLQELCRQVFDVAKTQVTLNIIGSLLLSAGKANDYADLTLNGAASNLILTEEQMPSLGQVTFDVV